MLACLSLPITSFCSWHKVEAPSGKHLLHEWMDPIDFNPKVRYWWQRNLKVKKILEMDSNTPTNYIQEASKLVGRTSSFFNIYLFLS